MTYCVAMCLDEGLVCLSDSRTNAGVDHINTFRKMIVFERPGDRVVVLMSAGNLAITQAVVNLLREHANVQDHESVWSAATMFECARMVGDTVRRVYQRDAAALKEFGVDFNASFILCGQIDNEPPRLFQIYAAGNFIEASEDTPYFQIGESKYGKPIIDRVVSSATSLDEAAKCALISMDSTIRSNLSVGLPLDLLVYRRDQLKVARHVSIDWDNPYFNMIHSQWGASLRRVFGELPDPNWATWPEGAAAPCVPQPAEGKDAA
ncbi:proteasome-type protease [Thauera sinica]|uniref:Proteasome-type protease n=1 Tax=Thauera sinica TaxID=2665146 RepID=A0ABW1APQ6_9RHOO|nr:proteasome-type protease [Thauera sp. K11]ATE61543.1 peptidase [Thauera sp. K11]